MSTNVEITGLRHWFYTNFNKKAWQKYVDNVLDANPGKSLTYVINKLPRDQYITASFSWFKIKEVSFWSKIQAEYEKRKYKKRGKKCN